MPKRSREEPGRLREAGSKTDPTVDLTDEQWDFIADLFPWEPPSALGGRPKTKPRECLNGILWVLRTGARWKDLPNRYPPKSTCWDHFRDWSESGIIDKALQRLQDLLEDQGELDLSETFADGTFASAKKGANRLAPRVVAKAPS